MGDRQLDAVSMHDMLLVRDMRRVICDVVAATGRPREDWRIEDVAEYVQAALTAAETRGRLAGLREAAKPETAYLAGYEAGLLEGLREAAEVCFVLSCRDDVSESEAIALNRAASDIRKLIEETENG